MAANKTPHIKNFYTFKSNVELQNGAGGSVFGQAITTIEIYRRRDVTNLNSFLGYAVLMKQRIIIPNATEPQPGPSSLTSYLNYPAILFNKVDIQVNNGGVIKLHQIFPKTLNSSVSTSASTNSGTNQSTTQQSSTGSTDTNVNTFGVGLQLGFFGELPMGGISLDYSHSWEKSNFDSNSNSQSAGRDSSAGFGESMSIKDWSSYGYLDADAVSPRWLWGQSYPWDVIQYNQSSDGSTINLPTFVIDRLMNGQIVLPPSQLSLFGTDFTMQAGWYVDFPNGLTSDETITITNVTESYAASHQASGGTISASLQTESQAAGASFNSGAINLSTFSLNPVNGSQNGSGAAIGFTATPFSYAPTSQTTPFKIVSPANNVQVTGLGFNPDMTSDLTNPTSLSVTFKIADVSVDYSLVLMHWIGKTSGSCKLTWTVNNKSTGTLYVEGTEGAGGQNNLSTIELRNTDFTSINFHDYLVVGTNEIAIIIEPVDPTKSVAYSLFALAIGQA